MLHNDKLDDSVGDFTTCESISKETCCQKQAVSATENDFDSMDDPLNLKQQNTGRWTEEEHKLFLQGLHIFPPRAWKQIATLINTRTVVQIRTHAQKYYQKVEKEENRAKEKQRNSEVSELHQYTEANQQQLKRKRMSSSSRKRKFKSESCVKNLPLPQKTPRSFYHQPGSLSPKNKSQERSIGKNMLFSSSKLADKMEMDPAVKMEQENEDEEEFRPSSYSIGVCNSIPAISGPTGQTSENYSMNMAYRNADILEFKGNNASYNSLNDACLSRLSPVDNDILQLADEESLNWFFECSKNKCFASDNNIDADNMSPKSQSSFEFSPIFKDDDHIDLIKYGVPGIDEEDFVLDPDAFLTNFLSSCS